MAAGNKMSGVLIQSSLFEPLSPDLVLPWSPNPKQEKLFERWTRNTLIAVLVLFIIIPWLPVFEIEYVPPPEKIVKIKVVLEAEQLIPPKPPVVKAKIKPKLNIVEKPKQKETSAKEENTSVAKPKNTKEALTQSKDLANLSSQMEALKGNLNVAGMKTKKSSNNKKAMVAKVDRGVLGENRATKASLGMDVDESLMKNSSVQLANHETSNVEGMVSLGDTSGNSSNYSYVSGLRDADSIRRVFEKKKGLIYALYYDALNDYPDLHGKFIFKMVIQPNGKISNLILVSSELELAELEQKMLSRIQGFDFGVEDVSSTPVEYRFVFIPS